MLADEKIQSENQKEIIKLELKLEKANNQLLKGEKLENESQKEIARLETELEKVTDESLTDKISLETKSIEEQESLTDENLLIENQEKLITLEVNQHELTKEFPNKLISVKETDQWTIEEKMSEQGEFSASTWGKFYENSQNNYDNIKNTVNEKNKKSQPTIQNIPKINVVKPLTEEEKTIEYLFLNLYSSKMNKTVSINKQKYNHYIKNIKYLDLRWQNYVGNQLESNQTKFQTTFSTYVDDVEFFITEVVRSSISKELNKKKTIINIDDLKMLEAYNALSNYLV